MVAPPCDCPLQGDINGDAVIDVFDVIEAISVAFSGGTDPKDLSCPTSRTDVNNDGAADVFDVLYLIAKKGPTTLAVRRIEKPAFPLDFEVTGADAMVSGVPFEGPVDLVARLSRSGDAIPTKGDLEGVTKDVAVPASGVKVTIDTTRP